MLYIHVKCAVCAHGSSEQLIGAYVLASALASVHLCVCLSFLFVHVLHIFACAAVCTNGRARMAAFTASLRIIHYLVSPVSSSAALRWSQD